MTSTIGKLLNRTPVPHAPPTSRISGIFGGRRDATAQLEAYGSVGTLFAIVRTISVAVSRVEWHLYRKPTDARRNTPLPGQPSRTELTRHAALDLWNSPNPYMKPKFFREACQQHLELVGESTIVISRDPTFGWPLEMWPVRPDRMHPIKHPTEFLTGWIYTGPTGEQVPLRHEDVWQLKFPNPLDIYRGLGPVQAALVDLDSARYSAEWNRQFFLNSAEPGGVISVPEELDDREFERMETRWREAHQGVRNAHRVAVLEFGAEWKPTLFSPRDMQFVQLRNVSRELIREAFTIHGHMLGISTDVNKANAQAGEETFGKWLVLPRADDWKDVLNSDMLPAFQADTVEFDHDRVVPDDREGDNAERGSKTAAWATLVNAGADPDDAADVVGLPHMQMRTEPNDAPAE